MIMESIAWNILSIGQIRSLTLLDDPIVREILISRLRKTALVVSSEDIKLSWQKVLTKAKVDAGLLIIEIPDEEILEAFYGLLSKEFPYREYLA